MERKSLGSYIAALRKVNSLTRKDMAEKLSISELTVASWERDDVIPQLSLIPVIAKLFGITEDQLLQAWKK